MIIEYMQEKVNNKSAQIGVVGLGYVGLPVACSFAKAGFQVRGIDIQTGKVKKVNSGISPIEGKEPDLDELLGEVIKNKRFIASNDYKDLSECEVVLVCVETPVDNDNQPRYESLKSAVTSLSSVIKKRTLIIIESTIAPGTIDEVVLPIISETSGFVVNQDFLLGYCPERVMPGKLLENIRKVNRVVGGLTSSTANVMASLYDQIVDADLDQTDCITAELVKTTENAYRDVQIAFANEIALICEAVGGDVWKVRECVNKSPFRSMHLPGAGVGGHCIPKDPWLLAHSVKGRNVDLKIIPSARKVNDMMPLHILNLLRGALMSKGRVLADARVLILGYAYLEDTDDVRNSPSRKLKKELRIAGTDVVIHDPFVKRYIGDVEEMVKDCHAIVIMVKHSEYYDLDLDKVKTLMADSIIIDGRNLFSGEEMRSDLFDYWKVGVSAKNI